MSASQGTRLFKIASQINIGKDAIVEFLQGKGFTIENKPTSVLTDEMVNVVMDKFAREAKAAEKQREKLEKYHHARHPEKPDQHQDPRQHMATASAPAAAGTNVDNAEPAETAAILPVSEPEIPASESLSEPLSVAAPMQQQIELPVPPQEIPASAEIRSQESISPALTTVSDQITDQVVQSVSKAETIEIIQPAPAIDAAPAVEIPVEKEYSPAPAIADAIQPVNIPAEIPKEIPAPTPIPPVQSAQPAETISVPAQVADIPAPAIEAISQVEKPEPVIAQTQVHIAPVEQQTDVPALPTQDQQASPQEAVEAASAEAVSADSAAEEGGTEEDENGEPRRKKKKRIMEVEYEVGAMPQLRGLTVVGKIDLAAMNKSQERQPGGNQQRGGRDDQRRGGGQGQGQDRNRQRDDRQRDDRQRNDRPRDGGQRSDRPQDDRPRDDRQQRSHDNRPPRQDENRPRGNQDNRPQRQDDNRQRDDNRPRNNDRNDRQQQGGTSQQSIGERMKAKGMDGLIRINPVLASTEEDENKKTSKKPVKPTQAPPAKDAKAADKKKKKKKSIRETISEEDVERAIRETLAGMEDTSASFRTKIRQKKRLEREEREQRRIEEIERESTILRLTEFVTTADLAGLMGTTASEIIVKCMKLGLMVSINQRLEKDTITLIADDYGFQVEFLDEQAAQEIEDIEDTEDELIARPPIVTIMGHVDHGKTSLLDFIRRTNVVAGESGGITQHIGAYHVDLPDGRMITFLDTPGHEAFTAMRARGAQVTDIVVLVVAADDNVMPQTIEAISHAQAANVPIIVAINKIDKPDANPDKVRQQLADRGVLVEDWGGKYQCAEISAKKGLNIETLMEKILLEADLLELKANPDRIARGTVIEAHLDRGKGVLATVMVQKGTLKVGDAFVAGIFSGRVRAMFDERGNRVELAGPSLPVQVSGFDGTPQAGDLFAVLESEAEARAIANKRQQLKREQQFKQMRPITLDEISQDILRGGTKELRLIIKSDVSGSMEALSDSLQKLSRDEAKVTILHKGVGAISESDVMLAAASGAVIVGFHVSPTSAARKSAESEGVDIRLYTIIYDCINEIQMALEGLLSPEIKEEVTGVAEVRQVFRISKVGTIAGCYITSGKIHRNDRVRVLRDGFPIYKSTLSTLKRFKDDVREVDTSFECGISVNGFNDFQEGDLIEAYKQIEIRRKLS